MSFAGLTPTLIAIAILLSVVVRVIRSGASWMAVDEGYATADHLRDITGIMDYEKLQEAFGPPRMQDRVFPVTRAEVKRRRTGLGYLLGDRFFDGGSALIAFVSLMPIWPLWGTRIWMDTLLTFAGVYQLAGWIAATMLFGRR